MRFFVAALAALALAGCSGGPVGNRAPATGPARPATRPATAQLPRRTADHLGDSLPRYSPDGRLIVVVGLRTLRAWDARSGAPRELHVADAINDVAFARDGTLLTASSDTTVLLWRLPRQRQRAVGHSQ